MIWVICLLGIISLTEVYEPRRVRVLTREEKAAQEESSRAYGALLLRHNANILDVELKRQTREIKKHLK